MFALDSFSGAPISGYSIFSPSTTVSGLQANALLNSVGVANGQVIGITGVQAEALLNSGAAGVTIPVRWTTINTVQYPIA